MSKRRLEALPGGDFPRQLYLGLHWRTEICPGQPLLLAIGGDKQPDLQGSKRTRSAAEIAAELANPNTILGTMNFFLDYTSFQGAIPGASSAESSRLSFQPGMPYPLTETANLFFRPLFPLVLKQDVPGPAGFESKNFELGDITYDLAVFDSTPNGFVYGGGVAGSIPTATDDYEKDGFRCLMKKSLVLSML